MKNNNALISMAIVSQNANDPFYVFCEYIKYCIFSYADNTITLNKLKELIENEFGIIIPNHVIIHCLTTLVNKEYISFDNHMIKRIREYDCSEFDQKRNDYRIKEKNLVDSLIQFVKEYERNWDYSKALNMLIKVLDERRLAYDIFISPNDTDNSIETIDDELENDLIESDSDDNNSTAPVFRDELLVGKFIQDILKTQSIEKEYLVSICSGLMLCIGAYQIPSDNKNVSLTNIKNTHFIFDTRLLLRFVGCAGEAATTATQELVKMIQNKGGIVCFYPQTREEINNAFDNAIKSISNGYPPKDNEMRIYASKNYNSDAILRTKKANVFSELRKEGITMLDLGDHSEADMLKYGVSYNALRDYMNKELTWNETVIENDAKSIWETNMRRKGCYDDYCGTNKRLDVFVTNNNKLIDIALGFKKTNKYNKIVTKWNPNRLPVITDIRLTCRLWSPAEQAERLSLLYLHENAVAAQRPTKKYLAKVRELAIQLKEQAPEYSDINLPSFFDDNVTDAIIEVTKGIDSKLDIGSFADSMEELTELKAKEQEKKTTEALKQRNRIQNDYDKQTKIIINGAVNNLINELGWRKIIIHIAKNWNIYITVLVALITAAIGYYSGQWNVLWGITIPALLIIIDKLITSGAVGKKIMKFVISKIEVSYRKHIVKLLRDSEKPYEEQITKETIDKNPLLSDCRKIIE